MATTLQMAQFPQISAEYSKNLLPLAANFEGEITYAITAGDGGDSIVENSTLESFAGNKSLRVFSDTAFSLNFNGGTAFNHTVTEELPMFISLAIKHGNLAGDDPSLQVQVFTNGAHTENMVARVWYEEGDHNNRWNISAGQIPAKEIGDVLSFAFEFFSGNADSEIFIDRWKLEYDNANQGLPTRYDFVELNYPTTDGFYTLQVDNGAPSFVDMPHASATLDFGSIATNAYEDLTIALTGVVDGDIIDLGVPVAAFVGDAHFMAFVSATDVVTVRCTNVGSGSINPASGLFKVKKRAY